MAIFASVVKTSTIRLILLLAAARDYNLSSIDITMAYLQADLDEELFMRPPPNVHPFDSENRPIVCKLRRSLYGLRQAGRVWAILFASFLISWGLVRSSIDCCLYTYTSPSGEIRPGRGPDPSGCAARGIEDDELLGEMLDR